jgi:hypothetical protein
VAYLVLVRFMNALIEKALLTEPLGPAWKWRYWKLAVLVVAVLLSGWSDLLRSQASLYDRFSHVLLFSLILFISLTADFRWHRSVFIALRIGTVISLLLVFASLLHSVLHHSVQ